MEERGGGDQRIWEGAQPLTVFSKSNDSQKSLTASCGRIEQAKFLSFRYGLDFSEDEVDQINSHRLAGGEDVEREGRARGREEEKEEKREGKSLEAQHHEIEETTTCQIENRDTEVKVGAVAKSCKYGRGPSY